MATRPGHFCLSESNFLGSKWLFKPSYLKEYHAPQRQIITQLHGINYDKTLSPVGKPVTIWTVLSCLTGASRREGRKRRKSLVYYATILGGMLSPQPHSFSLRHLIRGGMVYQWIYQSPTTDGISTKQRHRGASVQSNSKLLFSRRRKTLSLDSDNDEARAHLLSS